MVLTRGRNQQEAKVPPRYDHTCMPLPWRMEIWLFTRELNVIFFKASLKIYDVYYIYDLCNTTLTLSRCLESAPTCMGACLCLDPEAAAGSRTAEPSHLQFLQGLAGLQGLIKSYSALKTQWGSHPTGALCFTSPLLARARFTTLLAAALFLFFVSLQVSFLVLFTVEY